MSNSLMSTTTNDLDVQIAKLEEKLNQLLDKVKEIPSTQTQESAIPPTQLTQKIQQSSASHEYSSSKPQNTTSGSGKSRKEILEEYEKGYLARLEEQRKADEEIQRAVAELQTKKQTEHSSNKPSFTRGSLPKGF